VQIILVSRHLKAARTITIMPRHVLLVFAAFFVLVLSTSAMFSWLSVHFRLPIVESLMLSLQQQESKKVQDYLRNNLQLMATRLGELQAKVLQLDSLGERLSGLAGDKPPAPVAKGKDAQGGPFLPAPLSAEALQQEINRLAAAVENKTDELSFLEARLLEKRVKDRLLPTTLPVKDAFFGSPFGYRQDPIAGLRAMHEGIDFIAPPGTPIVAAADGVIVFAEYHPEFGNMIDIDHGAGLTSRYAHLSRLDVETGRMVKGGERIGALGNTGRSTGPHLHFEVRMLGVAQNPALFLKQGQEFAQIKRR
jgi:murein DD-endopeptidase MepM/ murein hydrolase activator NlpD